MENYNSISRKAIRTGDPFGYLQTDKIPNFSFDGSKPFTLEVCFCLLEAGGKSTIYKQGETLELGFKNQNLYFNSLLGDFEFDKTTLPFELNIWYSISIVYDLSELAFYVNGLNIKTFKKSLKTGEEADYFIGFGWNGLIKNVQVYSCCLTEAEILSNYSHSPCRTEDLIAWFDFTENVICDKSKNKISIHQGKGSMVIISNVCPVLSLDNGGYVVAKNQKETQVAGYVDLTDPAETTEKFSLLMKCYPLIKNPESISTLYSNLGDEAQSGISLNLEYLDFTTCSVVVNLKTQGNIQKIITSDKTIKCSNWHDIGLSYKNKQLSLFVNGENAGTFDNIPQDCLNGCGTDYLGISLIEKQELNPYTGYISYLAKFKDSLTAEQFSDYMINPPYLLDNYICNLLYFSDFSMNDKISFQKYELKKGASRFYAIDTQTTDTKTTQKIHIGNESCPAWDEYTDSQKWFIEQFAMMLSQYCMAAGLISAAPDNWYTQPAAARYLNNSIEADVDFSALVERGYSMEAQNVASAIYARPETIEMTTAVLHDVPLEGAGVLEICDISLSACMFELQNAIQTEGGIVVITSLLVLITSSLIEALANRPKPDPDPKKKFDLTLIKSNFIIDTGGSKMSIIDPKTSAIDITKNGKDSVRGKAFQDAVCYVSNEIDTPKVKLTVKCEVNLNPEISVKIKGTNTGKNKVLGDFLSKPFYIATGETKEIEIELNDHHLNYKQPIAENVNWYIEFTHLKSLFMQNLDQDVYTVWDTPISPWKHNNYGSQLPWTETLDIAYSWINGAKPIDKDVILKQLTENINTSGMAFDTYTGEPRYATLPTSENGYIGLKLTKLNKDYKKEFKGVAVNSIDCAVILATLARLYGIEVNIVNLVPSRFNQGFHTKKVQPIGFKKPVELFAHTKDPTGFLAYHSVAVTGDSFDPSKMFVYDASLRFFSGSGAPELQIHKKLCNQSVSMRVNAKDAGTYRGMLVKDGEFNAMEAPCITNWLLKIEKKKKKESPKKKEGTV